MITMLEKRLYVYAYVAVDHDEYCVYGQCDAARHPILYKHDDDTTSCNVNVFLEDIMYAPCDGDYHAFMQGVRDIFSSMRVHLT